MQIIMSIKFHVNTNKSHVDIIETTNLKENSDKYNTNERHITVYYTVIWSRKIFNNKVNYEGH